VGFLAFLAWWLARVSWGFGADLSLRLYSGYLHQPYVFHLLHNSVQLMRNATGEVSVLVTVVQNLLGFISEVLVLVGISILLMAVDPVGVLLVVAVLGVAGWGFYRLTRSRSLHWGMLHQHHDVLRFQHLQQGMGGVKHVRLLGREKEFLASYGTHNHACAIMGMRHMVVQAMPRLWLELFAVVGLAIFVISLVVQGKPLVAVVPSLGAFAAGAFRLMPSVNRILATVQGVRYGLPVVENLHAELANLQPAEVRSGAALVPFTDALVLDDVTYYYPNTATPALRHVSLKLRKGESVGFIGGSGAGKSTLIDVILGLLTPSIGTVRVDGVDVQSNLRGWQDQIGYVPQDIYLVDDTLRRNVAFGLPDAEISDQAVWRALRAAQLEEFVRALPDGLETEVGERGVRLSGGQRQRIGIARALYHDPQVLVLDEATSSLDTATEVGVMKAVHALQAEKTVLIVAHRLSTVAGCDYLYRLDQGKVVEAGTASGILGMSSKSVRPGARLLPCPEGS
jgi:ABC-type multidrug transport system fused ATPase/permease subunit